MCARVFAFWVKTVIGVVTLCAILTTATAHAITITFDDLNPDDYRIPDEFGGCCDLRPMSNEYEALGVTMSDNGYLVGPAGPGSGFHGNYMSGPPGIGFAFVGDELPIFASLNVDAFGHAIFVEVYGPNGYRDVIQTGGEVTGMFSDGFPVTPYIPYELIEIRAAGGISAIALSSQAGVSADNLTFTYANETPVPAPASLLLLLSGVIALAAQRLLSRARDKRT